MQRTEFILACDEPKLEMFLNIWSHYFFEFLISRPPLIMCCLFDWLSLNIINSYFPLWVARKCSKFFKFYLYDITCISKVFFCMVCNIQVTLYKCIIKVFIFFNLLMDMSDICELLFLQEKS